MFKRKDGRWQHTLYVEGKRVAISGKTQKECMRKVRDMTEKAHSGITFKEVAEEYEEAKFSELAEGTVVVYAPALREAVSRFGSRPLSSITPHDVSVYLNSLASRYAPKTVSHYRTVLNQVFIYAISFKGVECQNPCLYIKTPKSDKTSASRSPLTDEQRAEIDSTKVDEFPLAFLIVNTGCRLGEACALQWKDIDFKEGIVHITKAVHWRGNRPYVGTLKTKNGLRDVPLLSPLRDFLEKLKPKTPSHYIISGAELLPYSQLDSKWIEFCKSHGLAHAEDRTWKTNGVERRHLVWVCDIDRHQIRHDYATSLFKAEVPVKAVQHLLGHSDYSTTMNIYVHWERESLESARNQMERYIRNRT